MMSEQISNEQRPFAPEAAPGMVGTPGHASSPISPILPILPILPISPPTPPTLGLPLAAPGDSANFAPIAHPFAAVENTPFAYGAAAYGAPADAAPIGSAPAAAPLAPPANLDDVSEGSLPIVKPLDTKQTPALRIARSRPQRPRLSQGPRPTRKTAPLALRPENPPPLLRLRRLLVGVVLLALAWVGVLAVVFITLALINGFPTQPHLSIRLAFYLLGAAGTLWLAVMALASIIVGAFSLTLALTTGGW